MKNYFRLLFIFTLLSSTVFSQPVMPAPKTVYFKKPVSWQNVQVYTWQTQPSVWSSYQMKWPGNPLTADANGWVSFSSSDWNANMIFNSSIGQTVDLSLKSFPSSSAWFCPNATPNAQGKWEGTWHQTQTDCLPKTFDVYFATPTSWGDAKQTKIYTWNSVKMSWPGVQTTIMGNRFVKYTFSNVTGVNLIFNNGTKQTIDLQRNKTGWFCPIGTPNSKGKWEGNWFDDLSHEMIRACGTPPTPRHILLKLGLPINREIWKNAYVYTWGTECGEHIPWPGIKMSPVFYAFTAEIYGNCNIVFNDGAKNKTIDLTHDNDTFNIEEKNYSGNWEGFWDDSIFSPAGKQETPQETQLSANFPNPFQQNTTISFSLAETQNINLSVYNILGQKLVTLAEGSHQTGTHSYPLDATHWAAGTYIYRLEGSLGINLRID